MLSAMNLAGAIERYFLNIHLIPSTHAYAFFTAPIRATRPAHSPISYPMPMCLHATDGQ